MSATEASAEKSCKLCGERAVHFCDTFNEHSRTATLHHYRCTACGSVFIGNDVSDDELAEAYATLPFESYYEEIRETNRRKLEASARDLEKLVGLEARVLDLGTGNGSFLDVLLEHGFKHVAGHEIEGVDLSAFEQKGCTIYQDFDYSTIPDASFDVVTMLDVAEHVPDPHKTFRACERVLAPGGYVYFHTPVVTPLDRGMQGLQRVPAVGKLGNIWQRGRTHIFHLQNYTPRSIRKVLGGCGFGEIEVRVENELSWPVKRYVDVHLIAKQNLPKFLGYVFTPLLYPMLATNTMNANKAIAWGRKPPAG